jgi:hypothetical protein
MSNTFQSSITIPPPSAPINIPGRTGKEKKVLLCSQRFPEVSQQFQTIVKNLGPIEYNIDPNFNPNQKPANPKTYEEVWGCN